MRMDVREFITLGALNYIVKHKYCTVVAGFENEDVLVFGFFVVEDLVHFEGDCLARPKV